MSDLDVALDELEENIDSLEESMYEVHEEVVHKNQLRELVTTLEQLKGLKIRQNCNSKAVAYEHAAELVRGVIEDE